MSTGAASPDVSVLITNTRRRSSGPNNVDVRTGPCGEHRITYYAGGRRTCHLERVACLVNTSSWRDPAADSRGPWCVCVGELEWETVSDDYDRVDHAIINP